MAARICGHSQPTSAKTLFNTDLRSCSVEGLSVVRYSSRKDEEKERLVVAHGESCHLSSRDPVADNEFIPRPIALDLRRRPRPPSAAQLPGGWAAIAAP